MYPSPALIGLGTLSSAAFLSSRPSSILTSLSASGEAGESRDSCALFAFGGVTLDLRFPVAEPAIAIDCCASQFVES